MPATLLLCWTSYLLLGGADLVLIGLALTYVGLPAAVAVAILRHDLYDIDRLLSATATYALVTGPAPGRLDRGGRGRRDCCSVATRPRWPSPSRRSPPSRSPRCAPACSAGWTAVSTRPAGRRWRPSTTCGRASTPGRRAPRSCGACWRPRCAIRICASATGGPGSVGLVDADGAAVEPGPDDGAVPVCWGGAEIGVLCGGSSPALRAEAGAAAALLVEVVRLRSELGAALHEVESSRARLLQAGYAERRRLERDLHDGAQQRLVSLGMGLRLAQRHAGQVDVNEVFDQAVDELATAVAELRRIAHGLRPSSLDDGLGPALRRLATTVPLPVELDVCPEPLPDEIATTAYYVASEAVSNAVKHADADTIAVRVARDAGRLQVSVRDDGRGGATARSGSGLAGLTDRVAAAGGALQVRSAPGRGTLVEAVLPCAS